MEASPSSRDSRIKVSLDPILSQIMRALARAKPKDVPTYLEKAMWLYENVDTDIFRDDLAEQKCGSASVMTNA